MNKVSINKRRAEAVAQAIKEIESTYTDPSTYLVMDEATFYLHSKSPSGFHIYSVSTHNQTGEPCLQECIYDLATRESRYFRDLRELKANATNLDRIFGRYNAYRIFEFISVVDNANPLDRRKIIDNRLETDEEVAERRERYNLIPTSYSYEKKEIPIYGAKGLYALLYPSLGCLGNEQVRMAGRFLNRLMQDYPAFEQLYRAGIIDSFAGEGRGDIDHLVEQLITEGNLKATKVPKILNISKQGVQLIKEGKISASLWHTYARKANRYAREISKKDMTPAELGQKMSKYHQSIFNDVSKIIIYIKQLEEEYDMEIFDNPDINLREKDIYPSVVDNTTWGIGETIILIKEYSLDTKRALEYVLFSLPLEQGIPFGQDLYAWKDYLRMATVMGHTIKYPKHLKTDHDIIASNYKAVIDENRNDLYKEIKDNLNELFPPIKTKPIIKNIDGEDVAFSYVMLVPETLMSIANEGSSLSHCVASYTDKVAEGKTVILFLRDANDPNKSLVTVEVSKTSQYNSKDEPYYNVRQARGSLNRSLTREENIFLTEWIKKQPRMLDK